MINIIQRDFFIITHGPTKLFDITDKVLKNIEDVENGVINIFSKGSTGALIIIPRDNKIVEEYEKSLWKLVPVYGWKHPGNAYAHLRSSLIGTALNIPVHKGKILLPQNNGIFFLENQFTNARRRHVLITIIKKE